VKEDLTVAAQALGLTIRPWEIRVADDFERVFAAIKEQRPDGLFLTPDALITSHHKQTIRFGFESRLPAMFAHSEFVEAGGLMSYAADQKDSWKRAADLVDKILKGTKPAVIPVEQPTKFEFVINLKTAKQIGQAIAPNVLARADRVIR
jgi:putative ABC transport system substrate-binding protein